MVFSALAWQFAIGGLVLFVPQGRNALAGAAPAVNCVLEYGNQGISFLFGGLVDKKMFEVFGDQGFVFGLRVLPMIIFVTALISVLYHVGVMCGSSPVWVFCSRSCWASAASSPSPAVTTIFLGQSEMPAAVRPFVAQMTGPELFAGDVERNGERGRSACSAGYAGLGVKMEYLVAASFMAVPGGLLFAKIICPTIEPSRVDD